MGFLSLLGWPFFWEKPTIGWMVHVGFPFIENIEKPKAWNIHPFGWLRILWVSKSVWTWCFERPASFGEMLMVFVFWWMWGLFVSQSISLQCVFLSFFFFLFFLSFFLSFLPSFFVEVLLDSFVHSLQHFFRLHLLGFPHGGYWGFKIDVLGSFYLALFSFA